MSEKVYLATVSWSPEDIISLRPEWTEKEAREWLEENEDHIQCRLIEFGWEVIQDLIKWDKSHVAS